MQTAITHATPSPSLSGFTRTIPGKLILGLAATAIIAAAAHIAIPLWFTPIPLTLQPLAVLGVGLAFGPVAGFFTLLAYLAEGLCGLPVFAPTGPGGFAQLLGPSGGFLMAYPLVAALAGYLAPALSTRLPRFLAASLACAAAITLLFLSGAAWLGHIAHLSAQQTFTAAVLPFLPGEAIKVLAAASIYTTLTRQSSSTN